MKQLDIKVTDYYSQPTPSSLVELQKRIFENRVDLSRAHIRSSAAIKSQIEAAKDAVGALIPIIGGTCTIANQCPAKYACMGCAGHAPDPAKRRSEEHTSELQSLMRISYAVFCLTKKKKH